MIQSRSRIHLKIQMYKVVVLSFRLFLSFSCSLLASLSVVITSLSVSFNQTLRHKCLCLSSSSLSSSIHLDIISFTTFGKTRKISIKCCFLAYFYVILYLILYWYPELLGVVGENLECIFLSLSLSVSLSLTRCLCIVICLYLSFHFL